MLNTMIELAHPGPAPEVSPPASFSRKSWRPGHEVIELCREMPDRFATRLMDLLIELDRFELEQRAEEDRKI